MKFYFRNNELNELSLLYNQAQEVSRMAVILGRRRVGKTSLALEFAQDKPYVYLFVAKKSEALLCESFVAEMQSKLDIRIHGKIESFKEIFLILLEYAQKHRITVIVDEFQEFFNINPSVFSDIQALWDLHKNQSHLNVIFIGSIYSMMSKIFENEKEPLFGRADRIIHLRPFTILQTYQLLSEYGINDLERLFLFYTVTGCIPKYLDILLTNKCFNLDSILGFMLRDNSPFLNEGRNQLIEEFGKDYATYFSILELISRGKTGSSEIQSIIHKNVSAYLDKLEDYYRVIQKFKPINAKPNTKLIKYEIIDNFLRFWFNYFHRNRDAIEILNFDYIKTKIKDDFSTYSGRVMEKFFFELLAASKKYNRIGPYWERGHKNEIDIVAINDAEKIIAVAEIKISKKRNSLVRLEHRATDLIKQFPNYTVKYLCLSLEDAYEILQALK